MGKASYDAAALGSFIRESCAWLGMDKLRELNKIVPDAFREGGVAVWPATFEEAVDLLGVQHEYVQACYASLDVPFLEEDSQLEAFLKLRVVCEAVNANCHDPRYPEPQRFYGTVVRRSKDEEADGTEPFKVIQRNDCKYVISAKKVRRDCPVPHVLRLRTPEAALHVHCAFLGLWLRYLDF